MTMDFEKEVTRMIEIDLYIDDNWEHFELDDTLKIIKISNNTNNADDGDIEYATEALNSPWSENGHWFKIRYDHSKKRWECKRIVDFYDGCQATLSVCRSDYFKALRENEDVFYRLQQLYNPENISF